MHRIAPLFQYCLIEFYKGRLPWAGIRPNESVTVKEETEDEDLFKVDGLF